MQVVLMMVKFPISSSYIEGDQCLQEDFVRLLDRLCQSGGLARWGVVM